MLPLTVSSFKRDTTQTHVALFTHAQLSSMGRGFAPEHCATLRTVMAATYDKKCDIQQTKHASYAGVPVLAAFPCDEIGGILTLAGLTCQGRLCVFV